MRPFSAIVKLTLRNALRSHVFQLLLVLLLFCVTVIPLSIGGGSAQDFIRVSLRSRGDEVDVNIFARRYFGGGGHKNAAGGKSFVSIDETVEIFKKAVVEYFKEIGI